MASTNPTKQNNRIMLFCMVLLFCDFAHSQVTHITAIPDTSFEQALIDANIDTNGLNGNILNSDAENVITLNIFGKNITDLTGIEAFHDLKNLYCYFNNISNIDVSNNLDLEILDIENNNIETLNISLNTDLKELYVSNNLLNNLDVSNNQELELLSCNLNNISSLDISNNLELEVLWSYSNNLSTLDISNNLELESLFCGDNQISSIDTSNNYELRSISVSQNNLNSFVLNHCSELGYLDVSNNNLSALDISMNSELRRLLCSNNNLSELDVANVSDLWLLHASSNNFEHIDLSANSDLRHLRLDGNQLSTIDLRNNHNSEISNFNAENNPSLSCIFVDDFEAGFLSSWIIDAATHFVEDESSCNALSVEETTNASISIQMYPNPASNFLNFKNLEARTANVSFYNVNGQLVKQGTINSNFSRVDVSSFSSGMYLLKIVDSNNQVTVKKFLKE